MTSRFQWRAMLVGASFSIATAAFATPQVVGDEACERYEVDMASFASCTDGKVVPPAADATTAISAAPGRSDYALYFAPEAGQGAGVLLAAIMPGFEKASAMRERPENARSCALMR